MTKNNIPPISKLNPPRYLFLIDKKGDKHRIKYFNSSHRIVICENEKGSTVNLEFNQIIDIGLNPEYVNLILETLVSQDYNTTIQQFKLNNELLYNLCIRTGLLTPFSGKGTNVKNIMQLLKQLQKGF